MTCTKLKNSSCLMFVTLLMALTSYSQTYLENLYDIGEDFVTLDETSYFFANSVQGERGLWKTDGTQKGTMLVKAIENQSYDPKNLFIYKNELYFAANQQGVGVELWKSDGTTSGTNLFKDLNPVGFSRPSNFTIYKGVLYFTAVNYFTSGGTPKLYRTDGTVEGTVLAEDIIDAESSAGVAELTVANNKLYFIRAGILYETDGTTAGTGSVVIDGLQYISGLHSFSSGLYFKTRNHNSFFLRLYRLIDLDNYEMLKEYTDNAYPGVKLYGMEEINNNILYAVGTGSAYDNVKDALWKTDGTPAGTSELVGFGNSGLFGSGNFKSFAKYNGELYFNAGPSTNSSLWKSDGTLQGTVQVISDAGINSYGPMVVLEDKLYFLRATTLNAYDSVTQENSAVWQLRSYRRSSGDDFFLRSDGKYVYAAVYNERQDATNSFDFFHSGPNPLMKIKAPYDVLYEENLSFATKIDSLVKRDINVQNVGQAPLAFSQVLVSGEGFYINGNVDVNYYQQDQQTFFPQQIAPANRGLFEVGFLPQTSGVHSGYLILRSNDTSQPEFRIKLEGYASEVPPESLNATFPTYKEIKWDYSAGVIQLDNSFIAEGAASGETVGTFSTSSGGQNFIYQMAEGVGSDDNAVFTIINGQLITGDTFQANNKNSYSIRVMSVDSEGVEIEESFVIGVNEESIIPTLAECEQVAISMTSDIYDVEFINNTDAIAVGGQGIILKTRDKGITWEQLHVIERTSSYLLPASLYAVEFVNENTGFILGTGTLLRTDDSGLTWMPLQMNKLPTYVGVKLVGLSPEVLLMPIDQSIYKSNDGGQTWFKTSSTGLRDNRAIYFYDQNLGFASDTNKEYAITTDGGITWSKYRQNIEGLDYDEDIAGFSFISQDTGYATTVSGKVLKTIDGGLSWSLVNGDNRSIASDIHFFDENKGYLVAHSIYETTDGGLIWNKVDLNTCSDIRGFAVNNFGDKIAVGLGCYGGNGRTIYTAPPNGLWNEVSSIYGTRQVHSVLFDDQEAYLFSESQSRKSDDGGITWKTLITPIDKDVSYAEKMGNNILIKDWSGPFYRSADGGLNWTELGGGVSFAKFDVLDVNTIFAFGTLNGPFAIYKSSDGGLNWSPLPGDPPNQTNVVEFFNDNIGFAGGFPGISRTRNGGSSWEVLTIEPDKSISVYAIEFVNDLVGIISTTDGYYKTNDGGESWLKLSLNAANTDTIVAITEQEWFIKSGLNIYKTNDGGTSWEIYLSAQDDIIDLDLVDGTFYFSDDDGGVYRITDDMTPLNAGYIQGDRIVRVGDEEIYTVIKQSDNTYAWTVTGANDLTFNDTFARVKWSTPGTYTLEVTPFASCTTGKPTQINVQVFGQMTAPEIDGPLDVFENSVGIVYTTPAEAQVSFMWSVTGQRSFQVSDNKLTVDWGSIGTGQIGLIKTDLISGIRVYNSIDVNVVPLDPFTILQTNATCRSTANGSLHVQARSPVIFYSVTLTGTTNLSSRDFSNETFFDNLAAGLYNLCIQEIGTEKMYCYQLTIIEPAPFEVSSKTSSFSSKEVSLIFNGGIAPYTVLINGYQIAETNQSTFKFEAENGDLLEVLSSGTCAFSYSEVLNFPGETIVSPNPVQDSFVAILGNEFPDERYEISVRIFSTAGQQVLQFSKTIANRSLHCDVSILADGVYIVQIDAAKATATFKIIKI